MDKQINRRTFLEKATLAGGGLGWMLSAKGKMLPAVPLPVVAGKRIGIIGLDTSHSTAFVEALNAPTASADYEGYKVVAAYPRGSKDIQSSTERVPGYTEFVKKFNVEIVDSIDALLQKVDVVMLETNDGRPHLEQALPVMKAGKPLFIDKPVAGSLREALDMFDAARHFGVPVFSSSSLRYNAGMQETAAGKTVGRILGVDSFSPSPIEKTHPDFFWYGIHGVEILYTLMGKGCRELIRINSPDTDIVVGTWEDGRLGSFRGTRTGAHEYGATAFGEKGVQRIGPYSGYDALLKEIIHFFTTGKSPVDEAETIEIYVFMEAADESKRRRGAPVKLHDVLEKARKATRKSW